MNRSAIHDLMDTLLSSWYHKAAAWVPPGRLTGETCTLCGTSTVADVIPVAEWPHDLIHELVNAVDRAIIEISESLADEGGADEGGTAFADNSPAPTAASAVRAMIAEHADDLVDVLTQCVEPKVSDYVSSQSNLIVGSMPAWSDEFPLR